MTSADFRAQSWKIKAIGHQNQLFSLETSLGLKLETFAGVNHLKKAVHLAMVVAGGLVRNAHAGLVQSVITLDDLFRE